MSINLLAPLTFDYPEGKKFIARRVCAYCGADLVLKSAPEGMYYAACPTHDLIYDHTHISRSIAQAVENNTRAGMIELRPKSNLSTQEIIKKLGF